MSLIRVIALSATTSMAILVGAASLASPDAGPASGTDLLELTESVSLDERSSVAISEYLEAQESLIENGQPGLRAPGDSTAGDTSGASTGSSIESVITVGDAWIELSDVTVLAASASGVVIEASVTVFYEFLDPALPEPTIGSATDTYRITTEVDGTEERVREVTLVEPHR